MNITVAMLWDMLGRSFAALETEIYGGQPVRGIKLLPRSVSALPEEYLYVEQRGDGVYLRCGGRGPARLETERSMEELFNALEDAFNRLRDWDMETHLALIGGCSAQRLLDLSEDILTNPITLMDPGFSLLARTRHAGTTSRVFREVCEKGYLPAETVEFYALRSYLRELVQLGGDRATCVEGDFVTINRAIRRDGRVLGYLSMPCTHRPYSEGVAECFAYLCEGVAECMEREIRSGAVQRYISESFLAELIEGRHQTREAMEERLRYIGLQAQGELALVVLRGADPLAGRYWSDRLGERLPGEKVLSYSGAVVVFLPRRGRLPLVLDSLGPFMADNRLACGVSRPFGGLEELGEAFRQADAALRLGSRVSANRTLEKLGVDDLQYDETVFHYQRYALHHMVEGAAEEGRIFPGLRRLIQICLREGGDSLRVLRALLRCERRPTQTGNALHMSRNNVVYRAGRLEEIMGVSLSDPDVRAELEASFRALELIAYETFLQNDR